MRVEIASEVLAGILAEAAASPGREACGLLLGSHPSGPVPSPAVERLAEPAIPDEGGEEITRHLPAANVASDPATRFEIDPAVLLSAYRAARGGGPAVLGCYHSHPTGDAAPSACDAAVADPDGRLWLIVGAGTAGLWRAVPNGRLHGRFDPVELAGAPALRHGSPIEGEVP